MPLTTDTQISQLENGVRVLTERIDSASSAAISVLIEAGPQDDPSERSGLAHLCEHALFLGTPTRSGRELAGLIDAAGGCFGGFTAPEYTCVYAHLMEDYVSYGLDLLGDILVSSDYPSVALDREKSVICQEIRGYLDDINDVVLQRIKRLLWPQHPLSRSITGKESDVVKLTRDDVCGFINQHYTPDRIIVAAAGAVDHDSIVDQSRDAFWALDGSDIRNRTSSPATIPNNRGGFQIVSTATTQCTFCIAIPTFDYVSPARYAAFVLNNLIGVGMSSRLYQSLRETHGLAYSIQSSLLSYREDGALLITGITSSENLVAAVQMTLNQLIGLLVGALPIDEDEIWKSKMQVRSQNQLASDMISNRVSSIATQEFHFGYRIDNDQIIAQIDAVTAQDLQDFATNVLLANIKGLAMVVAGPLNDGDTVCADLAEILDDYQSIGS